jgi:hypothetical protein
MFYAIRESVDDHNLEVWPDAVRFNRSDPEGGGLPVRPRTMDVFSGRPAVTAGMLAELDRLRAALPAYDVMITSHAPGCRYEAIRRHGDGPGPWAVISTDPADLWRELAPDVHVAGARGIPSTHAPPSSTPSDPGQAGAAKQKARRYSKRADGGKGTSR